MIHRNYDNAPAPTRVYWFSDKVVINNPGEVYGGVTRENLSRGGVTGYRNPTIAEAMKNMGFMERFGVGIVMAQKALRDNGNPPAAFDLPENFIFATVRRK